MDAITERTLPQTALTPIDMLNRAVDRGANIDVLEKLMGLQERWERNQERKAFDNAMAEAKAEMPVIVKDQTVDFTTPRGRTNYKYEDMAGLARQVDPVLSKHGLSYRYRTASDKEVMTVTCILSHRDGHSEENSLTAPNDMSGNKNAIQAIGSTQTYLQRYTLKAALGLAASKDDDGRGAGGFGASDKITDEQLEALIETADAVGADKVRFCKYMKVDALVSLPASRFQEAMAALEAKRTS
jgi:ERF superfamily